MTSYSTCRQCRARIMFVRTANGKMLPVDGDQNPDGNVACERDVTGAWVGRVLTKGELPTPGERVYMPHFATCPARQTTTPVQQEQRPPSPAELAENVTPLRGATR